MATRSRRWPLVLLIVLALLAGLAVAADRIGVAVAEHLVAQRLQQSQHLPAEPDVQIDGFPFLTQLAAGRFDEITIDAQRVVIGEPGHQATLSTLDTSLRDVTVSNGFHTVRAGTLTATGTATVDQVSAAIGEQVGAVGGGRLQVTKSVTVLGQTVQGSVSARPVILDGELAFQDVQLGGVVGALSQVVEALTSVFQIRVPLTGLPFGLRAQSVTVSGATVRFTLAGSDVLLSSG